MNHDTAAPSSHADQAPRRNEWRVARECIWVRVGAVLPPRCVKCNAPTAPPSTPSTVYWQHPLFWVCALSSLLSFVIEFQLVELLLTAVLAKAVCNKTTVAYGLCATHKRRNRLGRIAMWLGLAGAAVTQFMAMVVSGSGSPPWLFMSVGWVGVAVAGLLLARTLMPLQVKDGAALLKGACGAYLAQLANEELSAHEADSPTAQQKSESA